MAKVSGSKTNSSESRHNFQQERVKNDSEFGSEMYTDVKETNQKEEKAKKQQRKRRSEPKAAQQAKNP